MAKDLLFELGTEELPPKALKELSQSLEIFVKAGLEKAQLNFSSFKSFATPRRLAFIITGLDEAQADRQEQKLGPAIKAAFDKEGKPSKAAEGFAKSNGTSVDQLETIDTDKGPRLGFIENLKGQKTEILIVDIIDSALSQLPIPKRMRWGSSRAEFVRPVKWIVLVFGKQVITTSILEVVTSNLSRGHRFHANESFAVSPETYEELLEKNKVIADRNRRLEMIREQVILQANALKGSAQISSSLLDEVTALVEWPVALTGNFEERFLDVPAEALISSMVEHQKYFHILDKNGNLLPNFITVSNIQSADPKQVIHGNERVIRPRLSDAAFFYETDKKTSLASRCEQLKKIVFQKDLGTVYDKTLRVSQLAGFIATLLNENVALAERAGLLCKSDLVSEMVLEFTDLQGLMGYYYALNDGESPEVAQSLQDQYFPKGEGIEMPQCKTGSILALADRIDTLIGIFGIGQQPTGNKDPFALRRAALGILRIIVDQNLDLDLSVLFSKSFELYNGANTFSAPDTVESALRYTIDRFRAYYQSKGYITEIFLSVAAKNITRPLDFDRRVHAVYTFNQMEEASALASANKRVANILAKQGGQVIAPNIDQSLLQEKAESSLVSSLDTIADKLSSAVEANDYTLVLTTLATLKPVVDEFFDTVMVMVDDEELRNNRLAILDRLRNSFLQVADISLLANK